MANVGYVNKAVQAMYGIPLSQLTPQQRKILKKDGERRAKLIAERQKEVMRDNRKAFEDEAQFERVLGKMYQQAQDKILADVTKTMAEVEANGGVWSYANQSALTRSKGLFDQINSELSKLGVKEIKAFNSFLTNEYTDQFTRALFTLGQTMPLKGEGAFAMLNPRLVQATLNYPWSGAMFSDRLWLDKERLGRNLRTGLTQSMVLGEGIPQITKRISNGINTSQYNAERIARTEVKRVCYTSQEEAWKSQGIEELRYMTAGNGTGANICDVCRADHGKVFKLGEEPTLPRHPNCRCWYVPLTPDTFKPGELNELTNSVRGAENYEKWMEANRDKLNPDGTLKDGWVRDWKNGGKLVYDPNRLKDDRVFRYHSVDEYQKRISEMETEIKDLQDQKLATTGVLKGIYTPEEKGYTDLSTTAQLDKGITLRMKELEKQKIELEYEMKDLKANPPKPPTPTPPVTQVQKAQDQLRAVASKPISPDGDIPLAPTQETPYDKFVRDVERVRGVGAVSRVTNEYFAATGSKVKAVDFGVIKPDVAKQMAKKLVDLDREWVSTLQSLEINSKFSANIGGECKPFIDVWQRTGLDSDLYSSIRLNTRFCKSMEAVLESWEDNLALPFTVVPKKEYAAISDMVHEYGHSILGGKVSEIFGTNSKPFQEIKEINKRYKAELRKLEREIQHTRDQFAGQPDGLRKGYEAAKSLIEKRDKIRVSKYGDSSVGEFIAEAFCDVECGADPSPYSHEVYKVLKKYFGK